MFEEAMQESAENALKRTNLEEEDGKHIINNSD